MTAIVNARYRVLRRLGAGGMGEVYLAEDTELERQVALKIMSFELAQDANQRKRFRQEAKSASSLVHPNICVIHEVGETEDRRPFLAMEYVEGETLDQVIRNRKLRVREVIRVGLEVAEALVLAHSRGIVHRDIKPANVILDRSGRVRVLDFGLAKRCGTDELSATGSSAAQTKTGMLIGTPHYMSPEQVLGRTLDHRSDIFSLGAVLYELITGLKPFNGTTVGEIINNVVNQPAAPLGLQNPVFSPALDQIVFRCLEKKPENRFASAQELVSELAALRDQTQKPAPAAEEPCVCVPLVDKQPTKLWQLAGKSKGSPRFAYILTGVIGVVVLLAVIAVSLPKDPTGAPRPRGTDSAATQKSIAVLPFDNFTGEPEMDYLSDGLTEEITTALSRIRGLKVAARNSSFAYKGQKQDVRKIAQMLRVNTVLEGSIRKIGNELRVTAQLVNAADGYHLWSESYDRPVENALVLQEEIAQRIAERLQGRRDTRSSQTARIAPEAQKLYLQARRFWNKRTETDLRKAEQLFQRVIEMEPTHAPAHAGLAATHLLLPLFTMSGANEFRKMAEASAKRALELDPTCAEAHAVLGNTARDPEEAEAHFVRALQLDPNYATAHQWYGRFLNMHKRRDQGLLELKTAADLDPLSPVIQCTIPEWYYLGEQYDRAIEELRKVIEAFPEFVIARSLLIGCLSKKGMWTEALAEIESARRLQPEDPLAQLDMKGYVLARMGRQSEAQEILTLFSEQEKKGLPMEQRKAVVYLGLRDYDKVIDAFEKIADKGLFESESLDDPFMKELASNPRFQAIVTRFTADQKRG